MKLTDKQVAERTGFSRVTLGVWRKDKRHLPFYQLGGKIFFESDDIDACIKSNRVETKSVRSDAKTA